MQITTMEMVAFAVVAAAFLAIAFVEMRQDRSADLPGDRRIITNFGLGVVNSMLALALPFSTATAAVVALDRGWGFLHLTPLPIVGAFLLLFLARSLAMYGFHRASHATPWLWRFHRVHHTDRAFDLSTAFRSHPVEVLLATPIAAAIVIAVGAPLAIVLAVDATLLLIAMWEHGNLRLPGLVERTVGLVVATPTQHRLHHSPLRERHDRNYGDTLILWDRIFGTYLAPAEQDSAVGLTANLEGGFLHQLRAPFHLAKP